MATALRYKELVGGSGKKQNWKGLGIAFVVIAVICLFISAAIFLTTSRSTTSSNPLIQITERDIFEIKVPKPWNGTWISNTHFSYLDGNDSVWIYDCDTRKDELLFKREIVQRENIGNSIVSPSTRYILVPIAGGKIHSYYTDHEYDLYEKTKLLSSITLADGRQVPLSAVLFSNGDHFFAFIHNFNVYVYDIGKKTSNKATSDGNRDTVHNGLIEWIYEYEIFNRNVLLFWSPSDRYLAFIKLNLAGVPKNHYLRYDLSLNDKDEFTIPYPKHGDPLPWIDVYIYNVKSGRTSKIPRPSEYEKLNSDVYIYHVVWYCDTCLAIVFGNRAQNSSTIQLYEIVDNDKLIFKQYFIEQARKGTLLPRFLKPYFTPMGTHGFIIRFDPMQTDRLIQKSFPLIARIHFNQSYPQIDATSPMDIHVDEILRVDSVNQIFFTGSRSDTPLERQVYKWTDSSTIECLSCGDGIDEEKQPCGYAGAQFSLVKGTYYILECFGPSIPYATLHNHTDTIDLIQDNAEFREWTHTHLMPYVDYFSVPLDKKNTVGHGMIIFPPNYNPNATIASYPVIVSINDRLYDQRVTKKYQLPLAEFVHATLDNISIVFFDAHGSTGQDENYLKNNDEDWFQQQYEDYVKVAKHLKWYEKKFNNTLNETRFGLKARGPAAVIALKLLEENHQDKDEFICAFLQSPVNDLTHYHAVYTERINGLKRDVRSSYRSNIRNKSVAIVHGTADEVVHFKHSAAFAKAFVAANSHFEFKVYPDVGHEFDQDPTIHDDFFFFQRRFFQECLGSRVTKERKPVVSDEYD